MQSDNKSVLTGILSQVYSKWDGRPISLQPNVSLILYHQNKQQGQYLTDGKVCIMFEYPSNRKPHVADPFNKVRCPYYNVFKGCHKYFNCADSMIDDHKRDMKNPIPYDPFFHFSEQWQDFQKERSKFQKCKCSTVVVLSCEISLSNIANTGYYAPVMKILSSKKGTDTYVDPTRIHSVLFHPETIRFCFSYWRKLSRQKIFSRVALQPFSLISIKVRKEQGQANQLVDYDYNHDLLRYQPREREKSALVLISDCPMSGDYYCNQDLPYEVVKVKQDDSMMSFENRQNNIVYPNNIFKEQSESSSVDLEDSEQASFQEPKREESQEQEEEEDDDNILEKLYRKTIQLSKEGQEARRVEVVEQLEEESVSLSDD